MMNKNKDLYAKLIEEYAGDDLAGYIAEEIDRIKDVKQNRSRLLREKDDLKLKYDLESSLIREKEKENQNQCSHLSLTYCGDPSGNNDSYYECDHCGAYL